MKRILILAAALMIAAPSVLTAQEAPTLPQEAPAGRQAAPHSRQQAEQQGEPDMGTLLIRGLQQTEGCLGVKTCQWDDGKNSIVAWFENKAAAQRWYYSDTHMAMIGGRTDGTVGDQEHAPLEHVENDDTPIMVIASLTFSDRPELPGVNIPISQISIEMFAPLPGGAHMNGRVSPETFVVPEMQNFYLEEESDSAAGSGG